METKNIMKDLKATSEQLDVTYKTDKLKRQKYENVSFVPNKIARALSYLLLAMENEVYIPVNGSYLENGKCCYYLTLVHASELKKKSINIPFTKYDNQILLFCEEASFLDTQILDCSCLTFHHLLIEYSIDLADAKSKGLKICKDKFAEREYIKEFITELSKLQIENTGKYITEREILIAVSQFIKMKKDKPKTKRLDRN